MTFPFHSSRIVVWQQLLECFCNSKPVENHDKTKLNLSLHKSGITWLRICLVGIAFCVTASVTTGNICWRCCFNNNFICFFCRHLVHLIYLIRFRSLDCGIHRNSCRRLHTCSASFKHRTWNSWDLFAHFFYFYHLLFYICCWAK